MRGVLKNRNSSHFWKGQQRHYHDQDEEFILVLRDSIVLRETDWILPRSYWKYTSEKSYLIYKALNRLVYHTSTLIGSMYPDITKSLRKLPSLLSLKRLTKAMPMFVSSKHPKNFSFTAYLSSNGLRHIQKKCWRELKWSRWILLNF